MRALSEAAGRELKWKSRGFLARTFDLLDGETGAGEPYATLVWRRGFHPPAEAEAVEGRWLFRRRGLWRASVLVFAAGAEKPLATYQSYWGRGAVRFEDGREFLWRRSSFLSLTWSFVDASGIAVVRLRGRPWSFRSRVAVDLDPAWPRGADAALLACLGFDLLLRARRRSGADSV